MTKSNLAGPLAAGLVLMAASTACAFPPIISIGCDSCPTECAPCKTQCPPAFTWFFEGPPKLKFKRGCPRPICDPCNLPHYGYYPTCWAPWPFPDDWNHCPTPTSAQMLPPAHERRVVPTPAPVAPAKDEVKDKQKTEKPKMLPVPKPLDDDKISTKWRLFR
ncbi:MAG: hypothetical protein ACRC33_16695 [Gemmataceae bacterium]